MSDALKHKLLSNLTTDPGFISALDGLNDEDRARVEGSVSEFLEGFAVPLIEIFQRVHDDPELRAEFGKQLAAKGRPT